MAKNVKPIPDNYPALTPVLICRNSASVIDFYKKVFGAKERMRMPGPDGKLSHAEVTINGQVLMLSDEMQPGDRAPQPASLSPVRLHLYVEDVDKVVERAVAAGAKLLIPVKDQFYGDRSGRLEDPAGHIWMISTHIEDVSEEELKRRMPQLVGAH